MVEIEVEIADAKSEETTDPLKQEQTDNKLVVREPSTPPPVPRKRKSDFKPMEAEFRAEQPSEVVGRDEVDPDSLLPAWDTKGHIAVKKASSTVAMPTCVRARSGESQGGKRDPPGRWSDDHTIRKMAYKLVGQEGYKLGEALKKAWKDTTVKERHFITPLVLYSKRLLEPWQPWPGKGKGKDSKGKGGNKGKSAKGKGSSRTPHNKPICFRYNSKGGCKQGDKCHFSHVCTLCFAKRSSYQCKANKNDRQGAAATWPGLLPKPATMDTATATPAFGPRRDALDTEDSRASGPREAKAAAQPQQRATADKVLRVLYVFSGTPRKHDMTSCLQEMCRVSGYKLAMECIDIKRKPRVDLSYSKQRNRILNKIKAGAYDAILLSPPCSTFTRAVWANFKGPCPVQSYEKPRGLDNLTAAERDKAILGNIFADFCWEITTATADSKLSFLLLDQPEDLGAMRYGLCTGKRPCSMWQWPQFAKILEKESNTSCVFHQGGPKPTRLLLKTKIELPSFCHVGPPTFDGDGYYTGPLPQAKGMGSIRGRQAKGPFKTSGTECWPPRVCQWIASLIGASWPPPATTATADPPTMSPQDTADIFPIC